MPELKLEYNKAIKETKSVSKHALDLINSSKTFIMTKTFLMNLEGIQQILCQKLIKQNRYKKYKVTIN